MDKVDGSQAHNNAGSIQVLKTEAVTPHNKALYEAGKTILIDSVKTGRDFCQFMITTSTAAIPVYLTIIAFLLPKDYKLGIVIGIVTTGPAVLFLLAALLFAIGYFPMSEYFSLDIIEEIEKARSRIISRRRTLAIVGMSIFAIATLYAIVVFIINVGAK
jgi:hypothetical protein